MLSRFAPVFVLSAWVVVPFSAFAGILDLPITPIVGADLLCTNAGVLYAIDTHSANPKVWQANPGPQEEGLELSDVRIREGLRTEFGVSTKILQLEGNLLSVARVELEISGAAAAGRIVPFTSAEPVQSLPALQCVSALSLSGTSKIARASAR